MMNSTNGFLTVKASMPPNPFFGKTRRIPEEVVAPPKMQRSDHSDPRSIVVVTENKIEGNYYCCHSRGGGFVVKILVLQVAVKGSSAPWTISSKTSNVTLANDKEETANKRRRV